MNSIYFLFVFFLFFTNDVSGKFFSRTKNPKISTKEDNCCIPPKVNVNAERANQGEEFFRRLTTLHSFNDDITSEKMCNLMHFLFQQASLNNRPMNFHQGMFILFDSSKKFFNRLINPKKSSSWFDNINPFKRFRQRRFVLTHVAPVIFKILSDKSNDRYPAYTMKIPANCFSKKFDHVLFGEFPSSSSHFPYNGKRIYIKPDLFRFDLTNLYSNLKNIGSSLKEFGQNIKCRSIDANSELQCAKLRAFRDNTDRDSYRRWKDILSVVMTNSKQMETLKKRVVKYGIREIDQQSKEFQSTENQENDLIKNFRQSLVDKYGENDLKVRKGQEIIFTTSALLQTNPTCISVEDAKCNI